MTGLHLAESQAKRAKDVVINTSKNKKNKKTYTQKQKQKQSIKTYKKYCAPKKKLKNVFFLFYIHIPMYIELYS
jgi:hypothetical protein